MNAEIKISFILCMYIIVLTFYQHALLISKHDHLYNNQDASFMMEINETNQREDKTPISSRGTYFKQNEGRADNEIRKNKSYFNEGIIDIFSLRMKGKEYVPSNHHLLDPGGRRNNTVDRNSYGKNSEELVAHNFGTKSKDLECPPNFIHLQDTVLPESVTHADKNIPRVIHVIVQSKCVPIDFSKPINKWKELDNYSILFHDEDDVNQFLSVERKDLRHIANAAKCAVNQTAKMHLAKFVLLWDHGGFVVSCNDTYSK